jgi:hypothetical protein
MDFAVVAVAAEEGQLVLLDPPVLLALPDLPVQSGRVDLLGLLVPQVPMVP